MTHPFELPLPAGGTVGEAILAPLVEAGVVPTVVDVGARSGMFLLPAGYTRAARFIGFEPNADEHRKLVENRTDSILAGAAQPPFRERRYENCAVWDREETRTFYITAGPGACTMMGPTDEAVTGRMYLDVPGPAGATPYSEMHTRVVATDEMACRSLDGVLADETVDFLKIDVEGAELRVLRGAEGLLAERRILFVKSEFVFLRYYDEHPVFGRQHAHMDERGYRLLHVDLDQPKYVRRPTTIPAAVDRRLTYAGDAYFMLDPDRGPLSADVSQRLAAIALALGFRSLAMSLLHDAGRLAPADIDAIETALSRVPTRQRVLGAWKDFPHAVVRTLGRLGVRV